MLHILAAVGYCEYVLCRLMIFYMSKSTFSSAVLTSILVAWPVGGNFTPASYFNLWLKSLKNSDGTVK